MMVLHAVTKLKLHSLVTCLNLVATVREPEKGELALHVQRARELALAREGELASTV